MIEAIPVAPRAFGWTVLLVIALPVAFTATCAYFATGSVVGGAARPFVLGAYGLIGALGLLLLMDLRMSSIAFGDDGTVTLRGGVFYKRAIAPGDIDPSSIQVHPKGELPELAYRTNGVGLPGYLAGWFKGRDGARFFVVHGGGPAVSFSTRDGVRHIVGSADPARLVSHLGGARRS